MSARAAAGPPLLATLLAAATLEVLGAPAVGDSGTTAGAAYGGSLFIAVVRILCWAAVATVLLSGLAKLMVPRSFGARASTAGPGSRVLIAVAVLVTGVMVLAGGLLRAQSHYHACCDNPANVREATRLAV